MAAATSKPNETAIPMRGERTDNDSFRRALTEILDWAQARSIPTLALCWAAMAALAWRHGVPLRRRPAKAFGLYAQTVRAPGHPLLAGLGPRRLRRRQGLRA